ncbi:MAG: hypothetical protein D8M59_01200 [Planctomycetes bacterium]|nr:hypothetical protein [Planctomycetota bacterium]
MSAHWPIIRQLVAHPSRLLVLDDQKHWKAYELLAAAFHVASAIEKHSTASHVGIMLPTSGLFPVAALASWMLGRVIVPLNYLLKGEDLQYVCDDAELDAIVTVQPMLDFVGFEPSGCAMIKLEDLNFTGVPEPRWPAIRSRDDLATLLYTSGTSGRPKGVMLTHGNLRSNVLQSVEWAGFGTGDSMLGVLPQFHSFGLTVLTLVPLTVGLPVYFTAKFMPRRIVQMIRKRRPTAMVAIPSMYNALLTVKDGSPEDFASLRYVVAGGEPLPDAVAEAFEERFGVRIAEGYGLTETSPVSHWCRPFEFKRHSVGRPVPGVQTRIVDPEEHECPPGSDGEIRLAGPNIMKGYYRLPEESRSAFDDRGYFRTGDMGHVDENGFLYITGRIKEMMIIAGENVFPREIEEVLNRHPSVSASAVFGIMDPSRGEVPISYVELVEDADFDEVGIRAFCREHLAQYKVPREILHAAEGLPRNPTGKILHRELKANYGKSAEVGA